jgi:uncharacterized membrane-anchored protein YhcB (DUF1043 family)
MQNLLSFVRQHIGMIIGLYIAGLITPFTLLSALLMKFWNKKRELEKKREELEEHIEALEDSIDYMEKEVNRLRGLLSGKLQDQMEKEYRQIYSERLRKLNEEIESRKRQAEEEIARERIQVMREVCEAQNKVYKDTLQKLEECYKDNLRLGKELSKARNEIKALKGRLTNHILTVVKNSRREILIHALRQRSDSKNIANALKR